MVGVPFQDEVSELPPWLVYRDEPSEVSSWALI